MIINTLLSPWMAAGIATGAMLLPPEMRSKILRNALGKKNYEKGAKTLASILNVSESTLSTWLNAQKEPKTEKSKKIYKKMLDELEIDESELYLLEGKKDDEIQNGGNEATNGQTLQMMYAMATDFMMFVKQEAPGILGKTDLTNNAELADMTFENLFKKYMENKRKAAEEE